MRLLALYAEQTLLPTVGLMTCTIGLLFFFACLMTMGERVMVMTTDIEISRMG